MRKQEHQQQRLYKQKYISIPIPSLKLRITDGNSWENCGIIANKSRKMDFACDNMINRQVNP